MHTPRALGSSRARALRIFSYLIEHTLEITFRQKTTDILTQIRPAAPLISQYYSDNACYIYTVKLIQLGTL